MIPFLMAAVLPAAALAQSQAGAQLPSRAQTQPAGGSGVPSIAIPKTTEVIIIETPKQGVTPQQVMAVIPEEIKATVKLYLDGKIRQWYSRGDGKGVVFVVDAKTEDEARAIMETLPLAKEHLMDHLIHSRRTVDAAEGTEPRGVSVSHVSTAMLCGVNA